MPWRPSSEAPDPLKLFWFLSPSSSSSSLTHARVGVARRVGLTRVDLGVRDGLKVLVGRGVLVAILVFSGFSVSLGFTVLVAIIVEAIVAVAPKVGSVEGATVAVAGGSPVLVAVGGTPVLVAVGGTLVLVAVGGTPVLVGGTEVLVRVAVGGKEVFVRVAVGGIEVGVLVGGCGKFDATPG